MNRANSEAEFMTNIPDWYKELKRMRCSRIVKRHIEAVEVLMDEESLASLARMLINIPEMVSRMYRIWGTDTKKVTKSELKLEEWVSDHYSEIKKYVK